jgi:hypothetical protein
MRCSTNCTSHPWSSVWLAAPRPEPVREAEEVRFIDGVEHLDSGALNDFVFQRGNTERPLPPVFLRDVHPTNRLRPVRATLQPFGEVSKVVLHRLPVVPPRLAVHTRRGFLLETGVRRPQAIQVVDMVQERREPLLPVPCCCLPYPLQRTGPAVPARSPGRVLLSRVSLGQAASLHPLRDRLGPGVVRGLQRY